MQPRLQLTADELAALGRGELLLAEQYERLKHSIDFADTDPQSLYPLLADASPEDWEDLAAYPNAEKL